MTRLLLDIVDVRDGHVVILELSERDFVLDLDGF